jgi:ankyrin repeat protein
VGQADLFAAVRAGHLAEVSRLVDEDPALLRAKDERGASALLTACYTGNKEVRDFLLARTPELELHEAAAAGQLSRVQELAEADPEAAKSYSPDGFPIMALAAVFGHQEVARYLLGKGADLNAVASNGSGYTALTGAVASGHASLSAWLAENGANVNYRYANGYSPLLAAAANGHLGIVRMLLARGADLDARTGDGKNALALAEERKHSEVADYLRGLGLTLLSSGNSAR